MALSDFYYVIVVVDPNYGAELSQLPDGVPVWVADTPSNKQAAEQIWQEQKGRACEERLTTFAVATTDAPDQWCANILSAIDIHHDEYSHDPPYSAIEVIGAQLSESLKQALTEYELTVITSTKHGFMASKPAV